MTRRIATAGALALALTACSDRQTPITAPTATTLDASLDRDGDPRAGDLRRGAVFAATNQPTGNAIAVFRRAADGTLSPAGMFPTGGLGAGGPSDPLRSQGSLILAGRGSGNEQLLFVVNAGSNEISVLAVERDRLALISKVPSGGVRPTSLTIHRDLLYVLHAGSGTINGFTVSKQGELAAVPGSTRPITGGPTADPAQIEFTPDGRFLVVTDKMPNVIDTYRVRSDGTTDGPRANPSHGMTPFGFAFDKRGHLVVSDAFGGAPNLGAMSSYTISNDGAVEVISGSVPDFQTAPCWVVISNDGRHAYTSNTGSSSISSYRIGSDGTLTLESSVAASTDAGSAPIDMAFSRGSRYLYVLNDVTGTINGFRVERDGSLTQVATVGGLPPNAQGVAAN